MRSKDLQITVAWILLASLFMGAALWQAQVSVAREMARRHESLPPPTNTRHAVRPPLTISDVDPVADYVARCEKGMTIQEIRWVLTDFENAGLSVGRPEEETSAADVLDFRRKQGRWYLQYLIEGFRLSRGQAEQASAAIGKLFRAEYESQTELLKKKENPDPKPTSVPEALLEEVDQNWIMSLPFTGHGVYFPWELCELTTKQRRITWEQWCDSANYNYTHPTPGTDAILDRPEISDPLKLAEKTGGPLFLLEDPLGRNRYTTAWIRSANGIFPLLASQKIDILATDFSDPFFEFDLTGQKTFLQQLQHLHPSQLGMTLLLEPGFDNIVRAALKNSDL